MKVRAIFSLKYTTTKDNRNEVEKIYLLPTLAVFVCLGRKTFLKYIKFLPFLNFSKFLMVLRKRLAVRSHALTYQTVAGRKLYYFSFLDNNRDRNWMKKMKEKTVSVSMLQNLCTNYLFVPQKSIFICETHFTLISSRPNTCLFPVLLKHKH